MVMELHFFDPNADTSILYRKLPHMSQSGVVTFITLRLDDSMPAEVAERWHSDRRQWLRDNGIDPDSATWQKKIGQLDRVRQRYFYNEFSSRWHDALDQCHGSCVLRDPVNAKIVGDSLLAFQDDRYWMTDFVVMPNHAHLLVAFRDEDSMLKQCTEWKRFTGREINSRIGASGRFWQVDGFDHLVRSETQFLHLQKYIANNPSKANLQPHEYLHYANPSSHHSPSDEARSSSLKE